MLTVIGVVTSIAATGQTLDWNQVLVIGQVARSARTAIHTDPIEGEIVSGEWQRPADGTRVALPAGGSAQWRPPATNHAGRIEDRALQGGYVFVPAKMETDGVMLLTASGDNMVYVNGEPRPGDPYEYGYVHLPVSLHAGTNEFLFACGRGGLTAKLDPPRKPIVLDTGDPTLPDLITDARADSWGAIVVINATGDMLTDLALRSSVNGGAETETRVPGVLPLSVRKVAFRLGARAPRSGERAVLKLALFEKSGHGRAAIDEATLDLRIRRPDQTRKLTFISDIDGSAQYWALNPAQPIHQGGPPPAMFFSVHGAGVEAIGQADAYSPKSWGHIVAPTNRRPYGFDWEGWGREDALEVLAQAEKELRPDPSRIYLTGHSMGGHGAWQLGAIYPDHFAAVGPSAGWISFFSYAGGRHFTNPTPVEAILEQAAASSDTLMLKTNYLQEGVYILHGSDDDNVPVTEARRMTNELAAFHHDFQYHEQPGAGHWWDVSDEPGSDCVDWAPMFDFFAHHVIPAEDAVRQVDFTTVNPGVSATCHWLEIEEQSHSLKPSRANVRWDPGKRRFVGATENIARLSFSLDHVRPGTPLKVELDGQTIDGIPWPNAGHRLWLALDDGRWRVTSPPSASGKGPRRSGPFKRAFDHRMIFVFGTKGTPEENAWAKARARFDAESFWYRGNGSVDVIPDTAFDPNAEPNRGVILYGNADTISIWPALLGGSPVQVTRGKIMIGDRAMEGADQACLFLRPRPGSDVACVGVVSGTGLVGMRLTDRLNYFLSGIEYPDCTVIGPEMLEHGAAGIRAAGFFGNDWNVTTGEFAWRDK